MYSRILTPLDGSPTARRGLREAVRLARQLQATLVLLTVVDDFPMNMEYASAMTFEESRQRLVKLGENVLAQGRAIAAEGDIPCETVLREVTSQRACDAIVEEATKLSCDLIVRGTHGRRGFNRWAMGSDAELVVRESKVPVLLVRLEASPG